MHTKINVSHLEIFTTENKAVLHSNTHEIEHTYFWSTWPWIKPSRGKPVWNICLYIRRIDGGIQQVQNIDEPDKITAWSKLKHKSKRSRCTPHKCYQIHHNCSRCKVWAQNGKPLHRNEALMCGLPLQLIPLQSDRCKYSSLMMCPPQNWKLPTK